MADRLREPSAPASRAAWLALLLCAASGLPLLAGCAAEEPGGGGAPIGDAFDAQAAAEAAASQGPAPADGRGGLAGVVVDEAIRPLVGAVVRLSAGGLTATTGRDGAFRFADLEPGPYLLQAGADGHADAQALVDVAAGEVSTVRLMLTARPSEAAYRVTQSFEGFAEVTDTAWAGFLLIGRSLACSRCDFVVELDAAGRHTVIVEATMAPGPGQGGFEHYIRARDDSDRYAYALAGNPFRLELANETLGDTTAFDLAISPWSWPAPELDKRFQVFVTAFYNGAPPPDWSILQEEPR